MTETTVKSAGKRLALLSLCLALLSIILIGNLYYRCMQLRKAAQLEFDYLDVHYTKQIQEYQQTIAKLQQTNNNLTNQLTQLSTNKTNIYQINQLISLANQTLVVYNDVASATRLLNYAKELLNGNNDALFIQLKLALSSDLEHLNQLPIIDSIFLNGQLNAIATQVTLLNVANSGVISQKTQVMPNQSNWHKFLDNIKNDLFELVTISKSGTNATVIPLPAQDIIIRQNIQLDLLNARIALLEHDEVNWKFSLENAKNTIALAFRNNFMTPKIEDELNQLLNLDIGIDRANIDDTLKALNKLNELN